jgi:GNAT superfamily N-acetyltransferase
MPDVAGLDFAAAGRGRCWLRLVASSDESALTELFACCSSETHTARFFGATPSAVVDYITEIIGAVGHLTVVTETALGGAIRLVAVGSVLFAEARVGEIVLLVEDDWQGIGIGSRMARELADRALRFGLTELRLQSLVTNVRVRRLFTRLSPDTRFYPPDAGVIDAIVPLRKKSIKSPVPPTWASTEEALQPSR